MTWVIEKKSLELYLRMHGSKVMLTTIADRPLTFKTKEDAEARMRKLGLSFTQYHATEKQVNDEKTP